MSDEPELSDHIIVTTPSGFKLRLEPMGFDREGNQMWRQRGNATLGIDR
jgi:hypothetical protein